MTYFIFFLILILFLSPALMLLLTFSTPLPLLMPPISPLVSPILPNACLLFYSPYLKPFHASPFSPLLSSPLFFSPACPLLMTLLCPECLVSSHEMSLLLFIYTLLVSIYFSPQYSLLLLISPISLLMFLLLFSSLFPSHFILSSFFMPIFFFANVLSFSLLFLVFLVSCHSLSSTSHVSPFVMHFHFSPHDSLYYSSCSFLYSTPCASPLLCSALLSSPLLSSPSHNTDFCLPSIDGVKNCQM